MRKRWQNIASDARARGLDPHRRGVGCSRGLGPRNIETGVWILDRVLGPFHLFARGLAPHSRGLIRLESLKTLNPQCATAAAQRLNERRENGTMQRIAGSLDRVYE